MIYAVFKRKEWFIIRKYEDNSRKIEFDCAEVSKGIQLPQISSDSSYQIKMLVESPEKMEPSGRNVHENYESFTSAQLRAICHTEGPMLVLAGPGSGKTSVITARILYLIREKRVAPESILVITFTREAAGEMQKRFLDSISSVERGNFFENSDRAEECLLPESWTRGGYDTVLDYAMSADDSASDPAICKSGSVSDRATSKVASATDHTSSDLRHVCFGTMHAVFLKILRVEYGEGRFHLFGSGERYAMIGEILAEYGVDGAGQFNLQKELAEEIEYLKNGDADPAFYESRAMEPELFRKVYASYLKRQRETGAIDYDDLLLEAERLFLRRKDILEKWRKRFSYILVDEAQDNNAVQYRLLNLLAGDWGNLFLVGDDDQSLYAFRGAKPEQLKDFCRRTKTEPILLEDNFRSLAAVTTAAGNLISYNQSRQNKKMIPVRQGEGEVQELAYPTYGDQTEAICRILKSLQKEGIAPHQCAILVRTGAEAAMLSAALSLAGIEYDLREKMTDPLDHFGVAGVISFMKVAHNAGTADDWMEAACSVGLCDRRRLSVLLREIPENSQRKRNRASEDEDRTDVISTDTFFRKMRLSGFAGESLERFRLQLSMVGNLGPYAAVNLVRKGIGYETKYLIPWEKRRGRSPEELSARLDILQELARGAENYEQWVEALDRFRKGFDRQQKSRTREGVRLMTYHASKGLEFDAVILPDLAEGFVPHRKAVTPDEVEEERRMLFVAMTRAKDRLYLMTPGERLGKKMIPSRFLKEIRTPRHGSD